MQKRDILHYGEDPTGRAIEGSFQVNDSTGEVSACPVPDSEVARCTLVYCGLCAALSEGTINLPPDAEHPMGSAVGYVCRGVRRDPSLHINPATYTGVSVEVQD